MLSSANLLKFSGAATNDTTKSCRSTISNDARQYIMRISSSVFRYATSALWIDRTVFAVLSHNIESVFVFDIPIFLIVQALTSLWYFIYIFIDAMILLINTYIASVQTLLFFVYFYLYILTFYTICRVCLIGFWKVNVRVWAVAPIYLGSDGVYLT